MNFISSKAVKSGISIAAATAFAFSGIATAAPQAEAASKLVQVNCAKDHDLYITVDPKKNRWSRYCFKGHGSISVNLKGANLYISHGKKGHMWVSRTSSGWKNHSIEPVCAPLNPPLNISSISLY
ncbi:hypothetical protein PH30N_03205 [Cutibacterium modestum 30N]|uniref:hypothetical protein n=1 Tax=Cutibacterium modestum TaxID=2559073 RepID=UPI0020A48B62|nr:hypothetical protein [Cutibacterium modestum]MCP2380064.1 hypothetical protein [Cutibacterium modestum 30N]